MSRPLEDLYFNWLCAKVTTKKRPSASTHFDLLDVLHCTEFVWVLSGDDNRAEDGKSLRGEFLIDAHIPDDMDWRLHKPCSFLEMMIAFARRAEFDTDVPLSDWFWEFITNLGLYRYNDRSRINLEAIQETLDRLSWRTYLPDGNGGMFPLENPMEDQRNVEIWYQFCGYLVDQNRMP